MANVKIDRLEIRLKGISPQTARSAVTGLDSELLTQLARRQKLLNEYHTMYIDTIDSGTFRSARNSTSSELRRTIACKIVESITAKTQEST